MTVEFPKLTAEICENGIILEYPPDDPLSTRPARREVFTSVEDAEKRLREIFENSIHRFSKIADPLRRKRG